MQYKVIGISDEELKKHLGKRVQVEGRMAGLEQGKLVAQDPVGHGRNLAQIDAKSIRQVDGICPTPK